MQMMSCNLGRLGSRFNLIFEPQNQRVRHSALGLFLDQPTDLLAGIEGADGQRHVFPFTKRGTPLQYVETRLSPTSVTWVGECVPLFLQVELTFTAPFWPQDERLSLWPGYFVQMSVRPMTRIRWHKANPVPKRVKFVFDLQRPGRVNSGAAMQFRYDVPLTPTKEDTILADWPVGVQTDRVAQAQDWIGPVSGGWKLRDGLFASEVTVQTGKANVSPLLMWVAHTDSVVMEVAKEPAKFRYLRYWPKLADAVKFGKQQARQLLKRSRQFDELIEASALPVPGKHLFAQSFQSYLMNSWWVERADGREWFSVWEGNCYFHSTVDVEYNASMLYFLLWPRLLGLTLRQWTGHLKKNERGPGRYLDHDMGAGILANGVEYGHIMGVEEAANFLLLLLAHVRFNGDTAILKDKAVREAAVDLTEYLLWTDQRGSGFPSEDVWNTIDDSAPAIQFGRQQTYLAVKRLAALRAAQALGVGDGRCEKAVKLTKRTLAKQAWLGDHYAVTLDRKATDVIDPNTGKSPGNGELQGWDDYHIYSSNGLLLLLMVDAWRDDDLLKPMCADIEAGLAATLTPYGCSHSSSDPSNVWVSQNIWRDCVAHYLGMGLPDLTGRYWDLQVWSNTAEQAKCFADTYVANNLSRYPRGITCAGYLLSLAGLRIDRSRSLVKIKPRMEAGAVPLLPLADWQRGRIPWVRVRGSKAYISGAAIITGQRLRVALD